MQQACKPCVLEGLQSNIWKIIRRELHIRTYSIVKPGNVSPLRSVPDHIIKPEYALTGVVSPSPSEPEIKTREQIQCMWNACRLARSILEQVGRQIKVGMTTDKIDELVHADCIVHNAYPSPLLYKGYPKSVCTSVNNAHIHGIPDDRPLQNGDMINVDVTVYYHGYHGDTSETFLVGNVDKDGMKLYTVAKQCLKEGITVCKPGARFCDIGAAISEHAYANDFTVIPNIIGHGIGSYFHGPPDIYHIAYEDEKSTKTMEPGMVFTIEPVICEGTEDIKILSDKWTVVSADDSRSCAFEHTILITDNGAEIMTRLH